MGGKRLSKTTGNHLPNKCAMRVKGTRRRADRISQLPDDILLHILSFLPWKKAVSTSVLSSRWLNLWKYTSNLHLQRNRPADYLLSNEELMSNYQNWVNSVLESHRSISLKDFSIDFLVDKSSQHHVTKWLEFALLRRVERLELIWKPWFNIDEKDAGVLEEILKNMRVTSSDFKSIKVLCFKYCCEVSSDAIELFTRNCPRLEWLVLQGASMTSDLEVCSSLRHLDIRSNMRGNSIRVIAPNLTWLTIDHDSKMVVLEKVPKLVNMNFYCRYKDTMHDYANVAAQLETLIITLCYPSALFSVPEMPKLKKLVVYYRFHCEDVLLPVTCFIHACPRLEEFTLEISGLPIGAALFEVPKADPTFRHRFMKRFVLSGFCGGSPDRLELVRYIVYSCDALEEVVIGVCDHLELVRSIVDYCVPLWEVFPKHPFKRNVKAEQREAFENTVQLQQFPAHIKLLMV